MLVQCPLDGDKLQALLEEEHPKSEIFGYRTCPVCGGHIHGHGWRSRFAQDCQGSSFRIWIHRKCCRHCHLTFTFLPQILHVLKIYTMQVILDVLRQKVVKGTFSSRFNVPVRLQRLWYLQFRRRMRLVTDFPDPVESLERENLQTMASPVSLTLIKECADAAGWYRNRTASHHRLAFYMPP